MDSCVPPLFFNDNCLAFSRVQSFAHRLERISLSLSPRIQTRRNLITRERGRSQSFARLLIRGEERRGGKIKKKDERVAGQFLETRMKLEEFLQEFPGTVRKC